MNRPAPPNPLPTFASWGDRATYLFAEYKIPVTITILAGGLWAMWAVPQLPTPPEGVATFALAWGLLAIPAFFISRRIVAWIWDPPTVNVGVAIPGDPVIYDAVRVPPDLWRNAKVEGEANPMPVEEGWADYVVTSMEWLDDIDELRVRGCDPEMLPPGKAFAYHEQVERYYSHYLEVFAAYSRLKAVTGELIQTGHDDGLMSALSGYDQALAPGVSATDLMEELENDNLPDLDEIHEWELDSHQQVNGDGELQEAEVTDP